MIGNDDVETITGDLHAIIDTTELFDDLSMQGNRWRRLLHLCSQGCVHVYLPEVVIREATRHFRREARRSSKALGDALAAARLAGLTVDAPTPKEVRDSFDQQAADYNAETRDKCRDMGVKILPLPHTSHDDLLTRAMAERRPFDNEGDGYRDALIWETALALIREARPEDVVLIVTDNRKHFGQKDSNELADELQTDLAELPNAPLVERRHGLEAVLSDVEGHCEEYVTRLAAESAQPSLSEQVRDSVLAACDHLAGESIAHVLPEEQMAQRGLSFNEVDLPELESPSLYNVDPDPETFTIETYERYEDGRVLGYAFIDAQVTIDGFMYKWEAHDADVEMFDSDWNEHMAWVYVNRSVRMQFDFQADGDFVESVDFYAAMPLDNPG